MLVECIISSKKKTKKEKLLVGKRRHLSICVVGHSACLSSSEVLLSKTLPYKYEIDANVELHFWCVWMYNNYVLCTCVYLCNNEGGEVYWSNMYPDAYIFNLMYLEITEVIPIPLALMK